MLSAQLAFSSFFFFLNSPKLNDFYQCHRKKRKASELNAAQERREGDGDLDDREAVRKHPASEEASLCFSGLHSEGRWTP